MESNEKKTLDYHQFTHLIDFFVFIINFDDIKSNFPLLGPYLQERHKSPRIFFFISNLLRAIKVLNNPKYVLKSNHV